MRSVVMLYLVQLLLKAEQINGSLNRLIKFDLWREVRSWHIASVSAVQRHVWSWG